MSSDQVRGIVVGGVVGVGDPAPDFELPALIGGVRKVFQLSEMRGKAILLAFYPFNWQEASRQQMLSYQAQRERILASNAETVAITVESIMNTTAWEREIGPLDFPLCSDFWPHGAVCSRYGVLRTSERDAGASERVVYVVNRSGNVVFQKPYGWEEVPPLKDVLPVLESV